MSTGNPNENKEFANILVVDDDPISMATICHGLEDYGHSILMAVNGQSALEMAITHQPDVILLDINMPDISGIDVCKKIKANKAISKTPIIFLTASKTDCTHAFDVGGVDYILKPCNNKEVLSRVNVHASNSKLMQDLARSNKALEALTNSLEEKVTERTKALYESNENLKAQIAETQRLQQQLEMLHKYDVNTRMLNRLSMEEHLEVKLLEAQMLPEHPLYYMTIDVDRFQLVNESFGHQVGDQLLGELAQIIKSTESEEDVAARMGGDEFSMIFSQPNIDKAQQKARSLQQKIKNTRFAWNGSNIQIDISMGLVALTAEFQDANHIMSAAERLCFESKLKGGGELLTYSTAKEYASDNEQELSWVAIIQNALDNDKFELHVQGIYPLSGDKPQIFEVLLRMQSDDGALISPNEFIPIAERYHLITDIDKWVLARACQLLKQNNDSDLQLAINVSGESLHRQSFLEYALATISHYGVKGSRICFEITETSAMAHIEETRNFVSELSALGCEFALDDFGTGTSSYGFLRELAIQYVKIDGSFIQHIENEQISRMMVESIYAIAKEKQIKVVAEAVETEAVLENLKSINLDYAQGFYLQAPEPISTLF